jgi:hypothetical protein
MEGASKMTCSDTRAGYIYKIQITGLLNDTKYSITYKFEAKKCVEH